MVIGGASINQPYAGLQRSFTPVQAPDKLNKPERDKVEQMAALLSLGMFNVSVGLNHKTVAEKARDATMRQYKRSVGGRIGEQSANYLLSQMKPLDAGVGAAGAASKWDISKTAHTNLNTRLNALNNPAQSNGYGSSKLHNAFSQETWKRVNNNFQYYSPAGLFNVGRNLASHYQVGPDGALKLLDRDVIKALSAKQALQNITWTSWKQAVGDNWKNFNYKPSLPEGAAKFGLGNYWKYSVGGNWGRGVGEFMSSGRGVVSAVISSLQTAYLGINTLLTMRRQYLQSNEKKENMLTKLYKTVKAGTKEFLKITLGYEVGCFAYTAVYASLGIPFLGAALALAAAATGGVLTAQLWKKAFGSSVEENSAPAKAKPNSPTALA